MMQGRQGQGSRWCRRAAPIIGLIGLIVLAGPAATTSAKKGKKKPVAASTTSSSGPLSSGATQTATASCRKGSHVTGGGFAVAPPFTPPGTGLRSVTVTSNPAGPKSWTASGGAFTTPAAAGTFTTYARCESDSLGKLGGILQGTVTLAPASGQTFTLNCSPGTHVVSGGYAGTGIASFTYAASSFRIVPLQSRRTGPSQWTVQVLNSSNSPEPATVTAYAVCERNGKGQGVTEASVLTPLVNDARATGDPSCSGKQHTISGGFLLSPNAPGPAGVPSTAIDEFQPVGKKGWHLGLHELVTLVLPPGSSLQTFVYCKKG